MSGPHHLRVEHLDEPFGVLVRVPRFSWRLPTGAARQVAYRLQAGEWDSGRVESAGSVLVPYDGPPLASRQVVPWRVRVWTDLGPSPWSAAASFELGLLDAADWAARWIEPAEGAVAAPGERPAYLLRRSFELAGEPERARAYVTAHGVYELFVNGVRVGDAQLTPGFTSYAHRLQVQTYDLGTHLSAGANELTIVVTDGWYRGKLGFLRISDVFGARTGALCQVELTDTTGARRTVVTDQSWQSAPSPVIARADLIEGETRDLSATGVQPRWQPVTVGSSATDGVTLYGPEAPPVRRMQVLRPRSITALADGRQVVDLGQNINGWVRLTNLGPAGTRLTLTHGEALDPTGDVTMDHLQAIDVTTFEGLGAGQVDEVISGGPGSVYEAGHSTKGFQYVRVEGHPEPLGVDDVRGVMVHTDLRRVGSFACSDADLTRLHEIAEWSFLGNACDIPTDCPQRERAGWSGDWQLYVPTAAFLFDVAGFSTKWLRDLAADQRRDGCIRNFAPDLSHPARPDPAFKTFIEGSAGWGDAIVYVPWSLWQHYGDERILGELWEPMSRWLDYVIEAASTNRHRSRIARSEVPLPHEQYLWDSGYHWGEWLEPGVDGTLHFTKLAKADFAITATAYFARSAATMASIAAVLGRQADAARYGELAEQVKAAWQAEFVTTDGLVEGARQADHVRALVFDLAPAGHRQLIADRLAEQVRAAGTHLGTGFLATPFLLPVLADHGHSSLAYELLFQRTPPSWMAMLDRGATTVWEEWEGLADDGSARASLNHYSKGAVISFLHQHVAGLRFEPTAPACERVRVAPVLGGGITWAEASHESPHGLIRSAWQLADGQLHLTVDVPPCTTATVELPDGTAATIGQGQARFRCPVGLSH